MNCKHCPYIIDEFDKHKFFFSNLNDDEIEEMCWCDKVGGKLYMCGQCSDSVQAIQNDKRSGNSDLKRRNNSYEKDLRYKRKLKKLYQDTKNSYPPISLPVNQNGYYDQHNPVYYKRFYLSKRGRVSITSYYKHQANKAVRRYKGDISKGCNYKKIFEYAWSVY